MPLTKVQSRGTENVGQGSSNVIINGAMNVAQRATSSTNISSGGYYTVDRFKVSTNSAGRSTMTQESISDLAGFANAIKLDCTTADTSLGSGEYLQLSQYIEGQNLQSFAKGTSDAKQMTLSFYVKGNGNATYMCELYDGDNGRRSGIQFSVTSSWSRVILTFDGDTTGAFDDDNNLSLYVNLWLGAGSSYSGGSYTANTWATNVNANRAVGASNFYSSTDNTFFITGMQLEVGSQASDFQHEDIGTTRRKCMRYFHSINGAGHSDPTDSAYGRYISFGQDNNGLRWFHHFPEEMRSAPTMTANNISSSTIQHFNYNTQTGISMTGTGLNEGGKRTGQIFFTFSSGAGVGSIVSWRWNNNPDASFDFDSEL